MPSASTRLLLSLLLSPCSIIGLAREAPAADPSSETATEEIVISATRTQETVGNVPASPTVVTRERIQQTPFREGSQVDDLLRYVPGVQPSNLSSRYNHPTAQAVTLRGLGSRRALVLLDGVPLNDGFGGWINWGLVPDSLASVEVVPGGGSNLYGTWAMGGVIHILTEQPRPGTGFRSDTRAGNLSSYTESLSGRYGTDRVALSLDYRWYHTNGFITVPPYQRGSVDQSDDSRHENFSGKVAWQVDPRSRLTISGGLFREDRSFGTPLSLATRTIGTVAASLEGTTRRGDQWRTSVFGQWQTFRNQTGQVTPTATMRLGEFPDRNQIIPSNDFGGQAQWTLALMPEHRLVLGTDVRAILGQSEDQLFTTAGLAGRTLAEGKQVGWGLYGEWLAEPTDQLTVVPSVRLDWWKNFDGRIESQSGVVTQLRDNVITVVNPKLAAQYRVTDHVRVAASVYQAFRAPTLNELYRGFNFAGFSFLPNENLSPERSTGGEAKLEVDLLPARRLTARVTGHYDTVKDQILFVSQGPLSARRENVGRTRTIGADVDFAFQPADWMEIVAGYAYADSKIASFPPDPTLEGNLVPNVSPHQVAVRVTIGHPDLLQVTLMGRYLSRQFADDRNTQPIADFVVLDASIQKQVGRYIRLYLDAENLTDRQYIATQTGPIKTLGAPLLVMGGLRAQY
jgi:outer membrane receptor protein involved in Fe transport